MFEKLTARGLGLASLAIGALEIAAPEKIEEMMGIGNGENTGVLRVLGVREIMHGVDLLTHKNPTPGVWARVAGDVLDGVLLTVAAGKSKKPGGVAGAWAAVTPIVLADLWCAVKLSAKR